VLPRFFADDMKDTFNRYSNLYVYAMNVYEEAEDNPDKREVIIAVMSAALAKEENEFAFSKADKRFAEQSKEYAESPQRKAALERMNIPREKETP